MTDQSQSWKTGSADPPRPANSTNPMFIRLDKTPECDGKTDRQRDGWTNGQNISFAYCSDLPRNADAL